MVKIPAPEAGQIPEGADSLQRQDSVPETGQQVVQIDFRALRAGDPLDVALLLPSPRAASLTATTWSSIRVFCWGWTA